MFYTILFAPAAIWPHTYLLSTDLMSTVPRRTYSPVTVLIYPTIIIYSAGRIAAWPSAGLSYGRQALRWAESLPNILQSTMHRVVLYCGGYINYYYTLLPLLLL